MKKTTLTAAMVLTCGLTLSACAGSAGSTGSANPGGGEGFAYDAPQEAVEAVLEDLEPITLKYQPFAGSETANSAPAALQFKEYIEERSNGKIEIDIIWGQAIAPHQEVADALADGRIDLAYHIPPYNAAEYPAFNSLMAYSKDGYSSPIVGELAVAGMMAELAWSNDTVRSEFTDKGLTVLSSMSSAGDYYMMCNSHNEGVDSDDWNGRSIRAGSPMNEIVIGSMGASPVSVQAGELFESLQRNTVGCLFAPFSITTDAGIPEVAPNISYLAEGSFTGRVPNNQLAGTTFTDLPLAYQQIVFDADQHFMAGWQEGVFDGTARGIEMAKEAGGSIEALPTDVQRSILDAQAEAVQEADDVVVYTPEIQEQSHELAEKWAGIIEELGYSDGGDLANFNDWYDAEAADFLPFGSRLFEETVLAHRPG